MSLKIPLFVAALLSTSFSVFALAADVVVPPKVHLVGDSTMANKPTDPPNPEHGWGQLFPRYFIDPSMVINYAMNGRSTKSFRDEGLWGKVLTAIKPGDFVIIQFGHNDEKKENPHFSEFGATLVAGLVADDIRAQKLPLAHWLK